MNKTLIAAILSSFCLVLDQSIINIAVSEMLGHFQVSIDAFQLIISGNLLMVSLVIPLSTYVRHRMGLAKTYILSLLVFGVANLVAGFAENFALLATARILQGVAVGILMPTNVALMLAAYSREKRGQAVGVWVSGATVALLVGPVLGGYLVDGPGWRWIFWCTSPLALCASVYGIFALKGAKGASKVKRLQDQVDWRGYTYLALLVVALLFLFDQKGLAPRDLPISILCGVILISGFGLARHIYLKPHSIFPRALFEDRHFAFTIVIGFTRASILYGGVFLLPILMQSKLHFSASETGLYLLPSAAMVVLITPFIGRLADFRNPKWILAFGYLLLFLVHGLLALDQVQWNTPMLVGLTVLRAVGICALVTPAIKVAFLTLDHDLENVATSFMTFLQRMGGACAVALSGTLLGFAPNGYDFVFIGLALLSIPGIVVVIGLLKTPHGIEPAANPHLK